MWVLYGDPRWQDPSNGVPMGLHPPISSRSDARGRPYQSQAGASSIQTERASRHENRGRKTSPLNRLLLTLAIHILCAGNEVSVDSLATSALASDRLRLAPAAQAIQESNFSLSMGDHISHHADIVLVGKLKTHEITNCQPRWLQQLYEVAGGGGNIVVDYTDHHMAISSPQSDLSYKDCRNCQPVCCSEPSHERCSAHAGRHTDNCS